MDQVHIVRHKVLVEGRSQRAVARELGLARVTVRKYLAEAVPLRKVEAAPRPRPVWDAVAERVQAVLVDSGRWTGGKQRLTATRLHELLVAEGHRVGVTVVKDAVAEWKRQRREVFVPLTYRPGDLAEVDVEQLVSRQGRDQLLHPVQERSVVHAGARLLAHQEAGGRADQIDRDLLDRRYPRALAHDEPEVQLADGAHAHAYGGGPHAGSPPHRRQARRGPLRPQLRVAEQAAVTRVGGRVPLGRHRHAVVANLDDARRPAHAEHVDVVARLVVTADADERRGPERTGELVGQRGELVGRRPCDLAIVGLAPRPGRIQLLERLIDRGHHRALAMIAASLALAIGAAHRAKSIPCPARRAYPQNARAVRSGSPTRPTAGDSESSRCVGARRI
jgi:transposase